MDGAAGGVGVHPRPLLDRSRDVADITLDDVAARRLEVDAHAAIGEITSRAAVLVAADALGACERMLELAVEYSKQRKQFGVPIGSFQAVKHAAAQIWSPSSAESIAFYAAQSVEAGPRRVRTARRRREGAGDGRAARAADSALTLHGADRLHVGARPPPVLQAGQARRAAVRHAGARGTSASPTPCRSSPSRPDSGRAPGLNGLSFWSVH